MLANRTGTKLQAIGSKVRMIGMLSWQIGFVILLSCGSVSEKTVEVSEAFLRSRILEQGELHYPLFSKGPVVPGAFVKTRILVDTNGLVESVSIVRGHPLLDKSVIAFVKSWRLKPLKTEGLLRKMIANVFVFFDFKSMGGRHPPTIVALEENAFVVKEEFMDERGLVARFREHEFPSQEVNLLLVSNYAGRDLIESTVDSLQDAGISDFRVNHLPRSEYFWEALCQLVR